MQQRHIAAVPYVFFFGDLVHETASSETTVRVLMTTHGGNLFLMCPLFL